MLSADLYESLKTIGDATSIVYIGIFLLAFFFEKRMSSATVTLLVLCLTNGIAILILPNLLEIASRQGIYNKFFWYGSWMLLNLVSIILILKFHVAHKIRASKVAITVSFSYVLLTAIQAIDFIDRATLNNGFFAIAYQISIPTISIGLIPIICYFWLQDFRKESLLYKAR